MMNLIRNNRLHKDERGVMYAEFLIAFPIMLMTFLTILQLSMIYAAKLGVRSAAVRASRAAVVVIADPDNATYYGETAYQINQTGSGAGGSAPGGIMAFLTGRGSSRMKYIRAAAAFPLAGFSPRFGSISEEQSLADTYRRDAFDLGYAAIYQTGATAVTFPRAPGDMRFLQNFSGGNPRQMLTTRVSYFYQCSMPIVTRQPWDMCHGALDMVMAAPSAVLEGAIGSVVDGLDTLRELGFDTYRSWLVGREDLADGVEEMQFSGNPLFLLPAALGRGLNGNRFVILRAEASMPLQGAEYHY